MKRFLHLLFISLLPVFSFSQTLEEKKVIIEEYNTDGLVEFAKILKSKTELEKREAIELAQLKGWPLEKEEDGKFFELMKVSEEGNPLYYTTNNVNAARSTRANTLHNGGILGLNVEGQNMEAHVWDAGLARSTHQEYDGIGGSNRFSIGDGTTSLHYHSAHVTGTIIASGYVASAKGMAPQADAVGYEWNNDVSEATTSAGGGMLLSNHSYGWGASSLPDWYFGAYLDRSRDWDNLMYSAPYYLMVVSAGNDGNDNSSNGDPLDGNSSYDKLSGFKTSKNNLTVANAQDANIDANGNLISVSINSSSSEGPTDDYRIKPDITGNGTSVYSTYASSDNAYNSISGTSMASPNVTGTLLLLQQHYNNLNSGFMRAATLKGLALHTADDAGPSGPDAVWGWGLLNGKEAANTISNNGAESIISELSLTQGNSYSINVDSDGINDLVASISWTDPPGIANTGTANDPTPALINDLDIRVTQSGNTYYPYRLTSITTNGTGDNIVDPFEKVIIGGASGTYTITVTHKGSLSSGSQAYSLIISGLSSTVPPVADFSANNLYPVNSLTTVQFTDQSIGNPTSWSWSFSPSTVTYVVGNPSSQNPQLRFNNPGAYSVTLYAQNAYGNDTEVKTAYIHMGQPGVWTGATSTNWNTATNWENHLIPTSADNVSVTPAATNWPTKTGSLTIGTDCNSLNMSSGYTELKVTGDITIASGKTFYVDPTGIPNIYVEGNWNNNGTFTPGDGTVTLNGNTNTDISSASLVNTSLQTTFSSNNGSNGNMFDIVAVNPVTVTSFEGNLAAGTGNVHIYYKTGTYAGSETNSAAWTFIGTTSVTSTGTDIPTNIPLAINISIPAGQTYAFYVHADNGNRYTNGNSSGSVYASDANIQILEGCGKGNPLFTGGTYSPRVFNGIVHYSYGGGSGGVTYNHLLITKTNAEVQSLSDINVNGDFTISPQSYYTINSGNSLNVLGNTIFMADPSGMASFIDNGTSVFSNPPNVQLFLSDGSNPGTWHFISSPVVGAQSGLFTGYYLYSFDEPSDEWVNIVPTNATFNSMQGYSAWTPYNSPQLISFSGPLNNGPYNISVTRNSNPLTDHGWNLVGNPYPSSLDWDAAGWTKTNVNNTIYFYSGSGGTNNYKYYIGSGGETPGVGTNGGSNVIPPLQGFFVHAGGSGTLGVSNNQRIHDNHSYYKRGGQVLELPLIRIIAEGAGLSDETVIRFYDGATAEFDGSYDALKLFADYTPQVYTISQSGTEFAISTLPEITDHLVVPLLFSAPLEGTYSFTFTELMGFEQQGSLFIEDLLNYEIQEVGVSMIYSFNHSPLNDDNRFLLHFGDPLSIDESDQQDVRIYSNEDVIYVQQSVGMQGDIIIYDLLGQKILNQKNSNETMSKIKITNGTGYYLVQVQTIDRIISKKVFIR